jgi:hypothetical protein
MKCAPFILAAIMAGMLPGCDAPTVDVTLERPASDSVTVASTPAETVLTFHSEMGIGRATITPVDDAWPDRLVLRLHLKALEGIDLNNGQWRLNSFLGADLAVPYAPVGRQPGPMYDGSDPTVDLVITRAGEVIEVIIPELFLDDDRPELRVQWVDYYRN